MRTWALGAASVIAALAALAAAMAKGQTVNVERPRSLVVGTPRGGARVDRIDASRTGMSRTWLPTSVLRREWSVSLVGILIERGPLVDSHGTTYVVGTRGEVVALERDGTERWRVPTSITGAPGPAALLSDDTLVFVSGSGNWAEAIGVRDAKLRWRTRFGRAATEFPAPLALDDGGVVVATTRDIAILDGEGQERARTTLPEATTAPLVSALGKVTVVTESGAVWSWAPGATEPIRVASFGAPIDSAAALADDHTLVAVTAGRARLSSLDLLHGTVTARAAVRSDVWLGPPAMNAATAYLSLVAPAGEFAVAIDAAGSELGRAPLPGRSRAASPDAGVDSRLRDAHTAPLVDAAGTLAFGAADGSVGVVASARNGQGAVGTGTWGGSVEVLAQACPSVIGSADSNLPPVVGLAPLAPGVLVAACRSGTVIAVRGAPSVARASASGP
jgi:hypothetical protein